jgi:hypothetical protein
MPQRFHGQINIKGWPVQVIRTRHFDVGDFSDRRISKPREFFERHKQFLITDQDPQSVW